MVKKNHANVMLFSFADIFSALNMVNLNGRWIKKHPPAVIKNRMGESRVNIGLSWTLGDG